MQECRCDFSQNNSHDFHCAVGRENRDRAQIAALKAELAALRAKLAEYEGKEQPTISPQERQQLMDDCAGMHAMTAGRKP